MYVYVCMSLSFHLCLSEARQVMNVFSTARGELYWKVVGGWPPRIQNPALSLAGWATLGRLSPSDPGLSHLLLHNTRREGKQGAWDVAKCHLNIFVPSYQVWKPSKIIL